MNTRAIACFAMALAAQSAGAQAPDPNEATYALIKRGGQVVLMRHALTPPGLGDPPGMRVDDCATQRNLNEQGRRHAKAIGEALRAHGVQFDKVLSSAMCRCLETARLAFGRVDENLAVSLTRGGEEMPRQVRELRAVATEKRRGGSVVLVSHGTTIAAVTGITPEPGEMLVMTPQGDGNFELRARLKIPPP